MASREQTSEFDIEQLKIEIERLKLEKERLIFEKEKLRHVWHSPLFIAIAAAALAGFGNLISLAISNDHSKKITALESTYKQELEKQKNEHEKEVERGKSDAEKIIFAIDKSNHLKTIENFSLLVESNIIQSNTIKNSLTDYLVKRTKLSIKSLLYKEDMRIQLINRFGAPVRIESAIFSNSKQSVENKIYDLFEMDGVNFDSYANLPKGRVINSGEIVDLVKLTKAGIVRQKKLPDMKVIHKEWMSQKKDIVVHIIYTILPGDKRMELKLTLN